MKAKSRILIIDDEEKLRQLLSRIIELEDFQVFQAANANRGLQLLEQEKNIDLIITDVKLPDANGIELVGQIKTKYPLSEVIVMTAFGTIHDGVKAIKLGAFDYFTKGDDNEQIIPAINRAIEKVQLQKRIAELENKLENKISFETILGKSEPIQETIRIARKVAPTDSTVLLEGETGVGKELFAQAIHNASGRRTKSFVAVNCSAFPKDLLESELFGHRKGAFTGATNDKKGLFEEAHEGTLFLDEMGEMNLDLQAKLLRVLETQTFIKVGDSKPTKVNVRIIAATNRNLKKESEQEHFRPDLYYRLSTFKITVPSLRERKKDIADLANYFLTVYSAKIKKRITSMDKEFVQQLKNYEWRGNIRELKNIIERAVILCDTETLSIDLLPAEIIHCETTSLSPSVTTLEGMEKIHIQKIIHLAKGNKTKAAELLGIGLTTLYRKIEEYHLEK
ncbi:MAG: sigma-54 dependent transcriptional regulator [Bacteroidetes bacterium]|nr:sigma-54 dependent transcriptional regulator [Bacteroidota bacterium]